MLISIWPFGYFAFFAWGVFTHITLNTNSLSRCTTLFFVHNLTRALCCCALLTSIDKSIDEEKKWFCENLSFSQMKTLNDITWTLNLIQIQLDRNWMQIGGESIENLLMNMVSKTKTHTHTNSCIFIWKWINQIPN